MRSRSALPITETELRLIGAASIIGLWLVVAAWLFEGGSLTANMAGLVTGILLIGLSLPRGIRSDEHYGSWDRYIV